MFGAIAGSTVLVTTLGTVLLLALVGLVIALFIRQRRRTTVQSPSRAQSIDISGIGSPPIIPAASQPDVPAAVHEIHGGDLIGQTIGGRYQVIEYIGHSYLTWVYKVVETRIDRYLALHVLDDAGDTQGDAFGTPLMRFSREAQVAAQLSHPNIVPIYDFGTDRGLTYYTEEYVVSGTLGHRLHSPQDAAPPLSTQRILQLLVQVAVALDYAHRQGRVHRDVRPSNLLLRSETHVLLANFGVRQLITAKEMSRYGFPEVDSYAAPEQLQGEVVGPAADIYALGVVLYEAVTGRQPFSGSSSEEIAHKIVHEPPPSPRTVDPRIPVVVEQAILRALNKQPQDRYSTAGDMARDLARAADRLSRGARVFISHSHEDAPFGSSFAGGLRSQGFDVWYDEHNLQSGSIRREIEEILPTCEHFVVIMSPAAVASDWVNAEIDAALQLMRDGQVHTFVPVVARQCTIPLLLQRYKRLEASDGSPLAVDEAVKRTAELLESTSPSA